MCNVQSGTTGSMDVGGPWAGWMVCVCVWMRGGDQPARMASCQLPVRWVWLTSAPSSWLHAVELGRGGNGVFLFFRFFASVERKGGKRKICGWIGDWPGLGLWMAW